MRTFLTAFFLSISFFALSQEASEEKKSDFILTPEFLVGTTAEANENFPELKPLIQGMVSFGWDHAANVQEWAQRLKGPKTGISLGYSDYGNKDSLGAAISLLPFIEFNLFKMEKLKAQVGMGGSYFTKKYDSLSNPNNQAITTDLVWSFRAFMYYEILSGSNLDWRLGLGYFHHSNGHTRLPNQGLNSFLFSLSADIKDPSREISVLQEQHIFQRSKSDYVSFYAGYGVNVLSKAYNDKKGVYTISGEYGKVFNKTFKVGVGFYYRFYQHYYDYIKDEEFLVREGEEFDHFTDAPWYNASNLGVHLAGEVLMNHIGITLQMGVNLYKPAYRIDWRINQGWSYVPREIPEYAVLGEFDSKFRLKKTLSTRMGLKYYLFNTSKSPQNNLFLGFHINANGGQADFTDLSLGFVHHFNFKSKD
jgi:hypothetical protein